MSRAIAALRSQVWAILPDALNTMEAIAERTNDVEAIERARGEPLEATQRARRIGSVGVIPLMGPVFRYANLFTRISGATSSEVFAKDLGEMLTDPAIQSIVIDVDSPGGDVNGTHELAELIYNARGEKPITAFISGYGASAAYWIASAADKVLAGPTALVGSVGAVITYRDYSKAQEKSGVRELVMVSSQSPRKRLDPFDEDKDRAAQARDDIQSILDGLAEVFITSIARNRNTTPEHVLAHFGQGRVMLGGEAAEDGVGLVDEVTTFEALLKTLNDRGSGPALMFRPPVGKNRAQSNQGDNMAADEPQDRPAAEMPEVTKEFVANEHPSVANALRREGAESENARITAIQALEGPAELKAECVADVGCSVGNAAIKMNAANKAIAEGKRHGHLQTRTDAEAGIKDPGPAAPQGEEPDDRAAARKTVARYNRIRGISAANA